MDHHYGNLSLPVLREQSHPACFVCGPTNGHGLGMEFHPTADGAVEALFACEPAYEGYPGILHGGIICTLLDGAMTNCLFAHGLAGITVDMNVRFRHPVVVGRTATVRARFEADGSPVHRLKAEVLQEGQVMATATARFIEKQDMAWFGKSIP